MTTFKKISSNYVEVQKKLNLPSAFSMPQASLEEYEEQIDKDLPRTSYLSFEHTADEIKTNLQDSSHLNAETRSYTQGNFDGGVLTDSGLKTSPKFLETATLASAEGTADDICGSLRIAYVDDDGNNCAFAVSYIRNDPDPKKQEPFVPVEQRKRFFAVAIIKNTTAPPKEREVCYITHPTFLSEEQIQEKDKYTQDIEDNAIPEEINKILNSKKFASLLNGLFNGNSLNMAYFKELDARLQQNQNIDNRDFKKAKLEELVNFTKANLNSSPEDQLLLESLDEIMMQSSSDINFYRTGDFEEHLETVIEIISKHDQDKTLLNKFTLTANAVRLELKVAETDEKKPHIRQVLLAQANILRTLRDTPEIQPEAEFYTHYKTKTVEDMVEIATFEQSNEHRQASTMLNELIRKARDNLNGNEALKLYLDAIELRSLTEPDFYQNGFIKTLETVYGTIDQYIGMTQQEQLERQLLNNKLTFQAIVLDHFSKISEEEITKFAPPELQSPQRDTGDLTPMQQLDHYPWRKWLKAEATKIRFMRDHSQTEIVDYKKATSNDELHTTAFRRSKELHDKLESLERQLQQLLDTKVLKQEKAAELREILIEKQKNIQFLIKSSPDSAEKYREMTFSSLISNLLIDGLKSKTEEITSIAKENLKRLEKKKPIAPENVDDNFWQRNRNAILIGAFALVTVISLVLIITGVLAPLGLALEAGTATIMAISGAAGAGAIALSAGVKTAYDEKKFSDAIAPIERYKSNKAKIESQFKVDIETIKQNFSELSPTVLQLSTSIETSVESEEIGIAVENIESIIEQAIEYSNEIDTQLIALPEELEHAKKFVSSIGMSGTTSGEVVISKPKAEPTQVVDVTTIIESKV
ncbi:hypothetical protein [Legionella brunensis]|uniref:Uncharacterized protein n=1 Tax=Legionella brunensis TaxID=29422 RepID=A0A0W0SVA1_9GAMM|nr:hypothetical protein [Legionella brunensis]KTC87217.1 hypothetical protein Lbru_0035 [Legionella brunensis]